MFPLTGGEFALRLLSDIFVFGRGFVVDSQAILGVREKKLYTKLSTGSLMSVIHAGGETLSRPLPKARPELHPPSELRR